MPEFVHLHLHSEYSLLDGACRIKELVCHVKKLGQKAVAVTDHGNMFAAVEFYNECVAQGVKAIIGCEVYVAPRTRNDRIPHIDNSPYHLVLLCKNNVGYKNLMKMVSLSYTEGFYVKPRVDIELLEKYHEGLICLSACLAGEIPRKLSQDNYAGAKETALRYSEIFGKDNYYIEIQNHKFIEQQRIIPPLIKLSSETGIPLCATNDCHYITREDSEAQKILMCISTGTTIDNPDRLQLPTNEFYVKSGDEMSQLFPSLPQALENTVKIADRCNVTFEFGNTVLPYFHIEGVEDNEKYLRDLCKNGLYKRYENPTEEAYQRLDYELDVITKMGYTDYYLIVWDFVHYAKSKKIPVGLGRGSGAGSLCAYCIGITGIDPLKYQLIFERFLNPERMTMPDFDIDFCMEGRQSVINYVVNKYGADHVTQIITFGTLAAKQAVRDVTRAMGLPYSVGDMVAKNVSRGMLLRESVKNIPELNRLYNGDEKIHALIDTAVKIEGMPRNISTHAAGVVITKDSVDSYVPLYYRDGLVSTQYTMTVLERLGLLKIDFLGLRNLTIINHCRLEILKDEPDFSLEKIPLDDKQVYDMLSEGKTEGVFQFESAGMTSTIMRLRPTGIEDLIAVLALYRPGPMDSIPTYIRNRHNPSLVTYDHPLLKDILDVTYGCIVYQEQVMQIFRTLAGYSYGRADLVRRAMSKKKSEELLKQRNAFIYGEQGQCCGCIANGVPKETAEKIFDNMTSFASYAFNKSHAAAYAVTAYHTAYLKCHYYKKYMAALMTNALIESTDKLFGYISDARKNEVTVLAVDINKSERDFVSENVGIRFALLAVKGLGETAIDSIVKKRKNNGEYRSLQDFCSRISCKDIHEKTVESLIKSGAFDQMGYNRHELLNACPAIFSACSSEINGAVEGQLDFFGTSENTVMEKSIERCEEYSAWQLLDFEYEALGMYVSAHPVDNYRGVISASGGSISSDIINGASEELADKRYADGSSVSYAGMVMGKKQLKTKKGEMMCFAQLEDGYGTVEVIVFPDMYKAYGGLLAERAVLYVSGKISVREDEPPKILASSIENCENFSRGILSRDICVRLSSADKEIIGEIKKIATENADENGSRLVIYFDDIKRKTSIKSAEKIKLTNELVNKLCENFGSRNVAFMKQRLPL